MTGWRPHLIALAVAVLAIIALFWRDVTAMVHQWTAISTYQHCLFIMPLAAWLIWQRRHEVAPVTPSAWAPGLAAVGAAGLLWLIGEAAGVALVRHVAVVAMVQASALTLLGPATFRALLFPIAYLAFLIPFGDEFLGPLQTITARISMFLLGIFRVPAHLDGVFITTPSGWFEIAEACSGVKFLVAMLAYGVLVANVCFHSTRRRIAFIALSIIAPIIANGIRAFGTIYAAHLTDVKTATGFDHIVYGWFFFAFVMVLVVAIGWPFFDRRIGDKWLDEPIAPVPARGRLPFVSAALLGLVAAPLLWSSTVIAAFRSPLPAQVTLPVVANWTQVPNDSGYPWVARFDGADHRLYGRYADAQGHKVDIAIALYGHQEEGRKIAGHGQGAEDGAHQWNWTSSAPPPPDGRADRLLAPAKLAREAWTFYVLRGVTTGRTMTVKAKTLEARLFGGDQRAGVIILSAEDVPGQPARETLTRFLHDFGAPGARADMLFKAATR